MMDTKTEEISSEKGGTQQHDKYKTREDVSTKNELCFLFKFSYITPHFGCVTGLLSLWCPCLEFL